MSEGGGLWARGGAAGVTFVLATVALWAIGVIVGIGQCNEDEYPPPPQSECDAGPVWFYPLLVGGPFVVAGCALMLDRKRGAWTVPAGFLLALAGVAVAAAVYLL